MATELSWGPCTKQAPQIGWLGVATQITVEFGPFFGAILLFREQNGPRWLKLSEFGFDPTNPDVVAFNVGAPVSTLPKIPT